MRGLRGCQNYQNLPLSSSPWQGCAGFDQVNGAGRSEYSAVESALIKKLSTSILLPPATFRSFVHSPRNQPPNLSLIPSRGEIPYQHYTESDEIAQHRPLP